MAKSWTQVEQSEEYQALSLRDKTRAKLQYWKEVVLPKEEFQNLSQQKQILARNQFFAKEMELTRPEIPESKGRQLYRERIAPLAHALSTFGFGIPKLAARMTGAEETIYPEQRTTLGKIERGALEIPAYIAGGIGKTATRVGQKLIPKLVQETLKRKALRLGLEGMTAGVLMPPSKGVINIPERAKTAIGYGFGSVALPYAGAAAKFPLQVTTKTGRWIAKNVGGITDWTVNAIKRLGADRVFDPVKSTVDYIGSNIVPRVKDRIISLITNFTPKSKYILGKVGFKPEEVEALSSIDKSKLKQLQQAFGNDWNAIGTELNKIKNNANLQFKITLQKNPNASIDVKDTFYRLGALLRKQGWINAQGEEIIGAGISNKTKTNLIKIYQDLSGGIYGNARKAPPAPLNIQQYFNKISELESSLSGNPKFDRLVFEAQESLRKDATKVIGGLAQANKSYSDATKLLDLEKVFTKISDSVEWEKQLLQLKNIEKPNLLEKYRTILGNDIYNDVEAHLAARDFELVSGKPQPGGGGFVGPSRIFRDLVTGATKKYYKNIQPKTSQLKQALDELIKKGINISGL